MANAIKRYRDERELTQDQLAKQIGVSVMTVSRWERGGLPRRKKWLRIQEVTGLAPADLVSDDQGRDGE